ncbi:hypothetical protein [Gordonia sp. DT101]|uniref:hypothetical protein n=1 Tax=Gordonia sp. DT101 TaxID=3416545 RepID=UPI003CF19A9E
MHVAAGYQVLADQQPEGPEFGKASPLALLIIIVLLVATALLIRSMNSQLKKLPKTFDAEHPEPDQAFDDGTDSVVDGEGDPETPDPQTPDPQTPGPQTPDPQTPDPETPDPDTTGKVQADERKSAET